MAKKAIVIAGFNIDTAYLTKRVDDVLVTAGQMHDAIIKLSAELVANAIETGDVRLATKFVLGLPQSYDRNNIRKWFEMHGPFKWDDTEKNADGKTVYQFKHKELTPEQKKAYIGDREEYLGDLTNTEVDERGRALGNPVFKRVDTAREFAGFSLIDALKNAKKRADTVMADDAKRANPKTDLRGYDELSAVIKILEEKSTQHTTPRIPQGGRGGRRNQPAEGAIPFDNE